jgi:metal-responsive CopG/Arc/MetJ family transcriptional regulator
VPKPLSERLNLSVSPQLVAELDEWRRVQPDIPGRAEAARRLIEAALKATKRIKSEPPTATSDE